MKITIHRGTKQIGGTCLEIKTDCVRVIFDIGEELPNIGEKKYVQKKLFVDGLFENSPTNEWPIEAVFISHYHNDHIGLIKNIRKEIPIYIGNTTSDIYNKICDFTNDENKIFPYNFLEHDKTITLYDLNITPFLVDHSAYDSYAFLIEDKIEKIVYTGDFRIHGSRQTLTNELMNKLNKKNIDILITEGTNLYKDNFFAKSEKEISDLSLEFMQSIKGNIFVLQSATNIDRFYEVYKACQKSNRTMVIDIFAAHILNILNDKNIENIKIFYPLNLTSRMFKKVGGEKLMYKFSHRKISKEQLKTRNDLCILIRESMYFDLIKNRFNTLNGGLIYSKWEGYKKDLKTKRIIDYFTKNNLQQKSIHTSGHADPKSIEKFINYVNPKRIIPIHTTNPSGFQKLFKDKVLIIDDKEEWQSDYSIGFYQGYENGIGDMMDDDWYMDPFDLEKFENLENSPEFFKKLLVDFRGKFYEEQTNLFFNRAVNLADNNLPFNAIPDAEFAYILSQYQQNNENIHIIGFLCEIYLENNLIQQARMYCDLGMNLLDKENSNYEENLQLFNELDEIIRGEEWKIS